MTQYNVQMQPCDVAIVQVLRGKCHGSSSGNAEWPPPSLAEYPLASGAVRLREYSFHRQWGWSPASSYAPSKGDVQVAIKLLGMSRVDMSGILK